MVHTRAWIVACIAGPVFLLGACGCACRTPAVSSAPCAASEVVVHVHVHDEEGGGSATPGEPRTPAEPRAPRDDKALLDIRLELAALRSEHTSHTTQWTQLQINMKTLEQAFKDHKHPDAGPGLHTELTLLRERFTSLTTTLEKLREGDGTRHLDLLAKFTSLNATLVLLQTAITNLKPGTSQPTPFDDSTLRDRITKLERTLATLERDLGGHTSTEIIHTAAKEASGRQPSDGNAVWIGAALLALLSGLLGSVWLRARRTRADLGLLRKRLEELTSRGTPAPDSALESEIKLLRIQMEKLADQPPPSGNEGHSKVTVDLHGGCPGGSLRETNGSPSNQAAEPLSPKSLASWAHAFGPKD